MEEFSQEHYNIIKTVRSGKNRPLIKVGNDFMKEFLFDENENAIEFQITALRIIFLIHDTFNSSNNAKLVMFQKSKQPEQLKLFEEDFLTEHNNYIKISLKNSNISKDQNKNHIEKAIEFLTDYKKQWHTSINSKGKKIRSYGGLITMPTYEEKGYTTFLISSYWLKKIVEIDTYTYFLLQTVFKISSGKEILFLIWLSRVNIQKGTSISLELLNQRFNLNYKDTKSICDQFLRPMRNKFDKYSLLSFNFSRKNKNISIIPYTNGTPEINLMDSSTKEKIQTIYKLSYFKKRHLLEGIGFEKFKIVFNQKNTNNKLKISNAYELLKEKSRKQKISITTYTGENFLNQLQQAIKELYKCEAISKTLPNGYLAII